MLTQFSRTELLLGKEAMNRLEDARVAVFGIGGVGGYVCEALARSGVGKLDLIDNDKVCMSNLNRQIIATRKTVGQYKTEVMKDRILDINPEAKVNIHNCFFLPDNADEFPFEEYDYVVDAVDTVTAKIALVMKCKELDIPITCIKLIPRPHAADDRDILFLRLHDKLDFCSYGIHRIHNIIIFVKRKIIRILRQEKALMDPYIRLRIDFQDAVTHHLCLILSYRLSCRNDLAV